VGSILLLTYLNSLGINNGKIIQRVFTSAKLLALFGPYYSGPDGGRQRQFLGKTICHLPFHPLEIEGGGFGATSLLSALGVALIGSLFSSDAWNNVTFIAGEIKTTAAKHSAGLLIGVLIVTLLYILANVAYFMLLPALGSPSAPGVIERGVAFAENDRVVPPPWWAYLAIHRFTLMALLIIISTFGCNNGLILSGARLFQSMANEGMFFSSAAYLNKNQVPSQSPVDAGFMGFRPLPERLIRFIA